MSAALPVALSAPAPQAIVIFLALGLGFGAPFTLLSFFPGWARVLPKPGAWMDRLKQFFAFPMFAAAVWLFWVLASQTGPNGVLAALALAASAGFVIWTFDATRAAHGVLRAGGRLVGAAVFLLTLAAVVAGYASGALRAAEAEGAESSYASGPVEAWSLERVAEVRAEGRPVFVDFTAAWCITCQFNKRAVLRTERVQRMFEDTGAVQLEADWTNRNSVIAAELEKYGRAGVPLYLLFPPEGEVIVLNEILTERHVIDALERAASTS